MTHFPKKILEEYDLDCANLRRIGSAMTQFASTAFGVRGIGVSRENFANFFTLTIPQWTQHMIAEEIAIFERIKHDFTWSVRSDIDPPGLTDALLRNGLRLESEEVMVALPVEDYTFSPDAPNGIVIREVGISDIPDMMKVQKSVWLDHFDVEAFGKSMVERKTREGHALRMFGAYAGDDLVSCAWSYSRPESIFVTLNGGTTLPEYRGRGIYRAMVSARALVARESGKKYLTVDAGAMSLPILERLGFVRLCDLREYVFRVKK